MCSLFISARPPLYQPAALYLSPPHQPATLYFKQMNLLHNSASFLDRLLDRVCHTVLNTLTPAAADSMNQLQLESILQSPAWDPPDVSLMDHRNVREEPVILYREEVVDPYLAAVAAARGLGFELWLRGLSTVRGRAAYDRAANKALVHVYGRDYLLHDRVGGCHFIALLRNQDGLVVASSIYVFCGFLACPETSRDPAKGFRGYMEQVHPAWRTPAIERLLFELGHSAAKFLALCDPFISHWFAHTPYLTIETGLDATTHAEGAPRLEDELLLRSLGYSLVDTGPQYVYHKRVRLSL